MDLSNQSKQGQDPTINATPKERTVTPSKKRRSTKKDGEDLPDLKDMDFDLSATSQHQRQQQQQEEEQAKLRKKRRESKKKEKELRKSLEQKELKRILQRRSSKAEGDDAFQMMMQKALVKNTNKDKDESETNKMADLEETSHSESLDEDPTPVTAAAKPNRMSSTSRAALSGRLKLKSAIKEVMGRQRRATALMSLIEDVSKHSKSNQDESDSDDDSDVESVEGPGPTLKKTKKQQRESTLFALITGL